MSETGLSQALILFLDPPRPFGRFARGEMPHDYPIETQIRLGSDMTNQNRNINMNPTTTETKPTTTTTFDPWKKATAAKPAYLDELLRPEYADRQLRLAEGPNWMRVVPAAHLGSEEWMLGLHVLATPTGKFAHPLTFEAGARSIWDATYGYLRKTDPGKLYCKANPNGLRLLPNPKSLCWVITGHGADNDTPLAVRLLTLSGYSGERGGAQGMGYQLFTMASDCDETGELAHNITGTEDGVQVMIEKIVPKESPYPRYVLRAGRQPCPISELLAKLPDDEAAVLQPLENVVRRMSEDEQWERLARLMPASEVATIRAAIER